MPCSSSLRFPCSLTKCQCSPSHPLLNESPARTTQDLHRSVHPAAQSQCPVAALAPIFPISATFVLAEMPRLTTGFSGQPKYSSPTPSYFVHSFLQEDPRNQGLLGLGARIMVFCPERSFEDLTARQKLEMATGMDHFPLLHHALLRSLCQALAIVLSD